MDPRHRETIENLLRGCAPCSELENVLDDEDIALLQVELDEVWSRRTTRSDVERTPRESAPLERAA